MTIEDNMPSFSDPEDYEEDLSNEGTFFIEQKMGCIMRLCS